MIQPLVSVYTYQYQVNCTLQKCFYMLGDDEHDFGPYLVNFTAGMTNASFTIMIIDNNILENNRTFCFFINSSSLPTSPSNISIAHPHQVTVTIVDDDGK